MKKKNNRRTKLQTYENTGTQYWLIKIKFSLKTQDQRTINSFLFKDCVDI